MDKKVQVELSLKDNISKQLKTISNKVRDVGNQLKSLSNMQINIRMNTNLDTQLSNIKKQISSLKSENIEIKASVNVDDSALKDIGSGINTGAMLLAGTQMSSAMQGVSASMSTVSSAVSQMSKEIQMAFGASVKDTELYQMQVQEVTNCYKELQSIMSRTTQDGFEQLFDAELGNRVNALSQKVRIATQFFNEFKGSVEGANNAVNALGEMKNILDNNVTLNRVVDTSAIKKEIDTLKYNSVVKQGVRIPVEVKNLAEESLKLATFKASVENKRIQLKANTDEIENKFKLIQEKQQYLNKALRTGKQTSYKKYADEIRELYKKIDELNPKTEKFRTELKSSSICANQSATALNKLQSEMRETGSASTQATTGINKMKTAMGGLGSVIKKLLPFLGLYQLVRFGKACVDTASDLQEVGNVIEVTFGDSADIMNDWAETNARAYGLSELSAKRYLGTMGSILQSSGMGDYTAEMSKNLVKLSGDLSSFYNLSNDEAFTKLRSGIMGEVEPLRSLGINMSVAAMESYALSKGINTAWSEMSTADQVMLRYNYLMETTARIQGDFANTQYSYANSIRTLQNSFASLKAELGQSFIALLAPIVQVIATIVQWLTVLAQAFNNFLRSIGLLKGVVGGASNAVKKGLGGASNVASGLANAIGGKGGVNDALGGTTKSAKEAEKAMKRLMGIDEIHKLEAPNTSSGSGAGGSGGGAGGSGGGAGGSGGAGGLGGLTLDPIDTSDYEYSIEDSLDRIRKKFEAFSKWLKDHAGAILAIIAGLASGIATYFMIVKWDVIKATILGVLKSIVGACSGIIGAISAPALAIAVVVGLLVAGFTYLYTTCEEFRNRVNKVFSEVGDKIKQVYDAVIKPIGTGIKAVWDSIIMPVLMALWQVTLDVVEAIWSGIEKAWEMCKPAIDFMCEGFSKLYEALGELWTSLQPVFSFLGTVLAGLYELLKPVLKFVIENLIAIALTVIPSVIGAVGVVCNVFAVGFKAIAKVIEFVIDFIKAFAEAFSRNLDSVKKWWSDAWSNMKTNLDNNIKNYKQYIDNFGKKCKEIWSGIKDKFATAWDNMKKKNDDVTNVCMVGINTFATKTKGQWSNISTWFSDKFNTIKNTCSNVCDGIKNFFSNTHSSITNTFNNIGNWFTNKFNEARNGISNAFSRVKDVLVSPIESAKNTIKGIVDRIVGFFSGARIRFPHIPLPHFSISPSGWSVGDLLKGSIPKLGISWYSEGGIFPSRTLLGVGDAMNGRGNNPEAVLPLNVLWKEMGKFADKIVAGVQNNNQGERRDLTIQLTLDGKILTEKVIHNINNQTKTTGSSPLIIR